MKRRIKEFFIIFLLVFCNGLLSQTKNETKPLEKIIAFLETKYQVQFNYAEDIVNGITINEPFKGLSLNESISYLQKVTGLEFILTDFNIILIKPFKAKVLCGYIKDKETLQPLVSATIETSGQATTSDENGFFKISINKISEPVVIRFLGYSTVRTNSNMIVSNDCQDYYLTASFQKLSEVLISNYIVNGINKIDNGSYEINFLDFDILPGLIEADVLQSVQSFPGIQSLNETVSNINIRGGTNDQNLILWDGIKMYQSGHFFGLISMYNPEITQKVSLRKNGNSVAYTDGVSGTIDMTTSKHINPSFKGVIGLNLTNFNGFVDVPLGKHSSIQFAARKSISDFVETPTYKAFFERISQNTEVENNISSITNSNKAFDFYDTSLRWIYKISDKDQLRLNFINVHNELVFNENATINNLEESKESSLSQFSIAGAINYERNWNKNLQTTLEIYETDYKLKSINSNIVDSQRFLQENVISETSSKFELKYNFNNRFQFLGGYHFVETEITNLDDVDNPLFRVLVSEVLRTHGVFSEVGYKSFNKKTNLNVGVRYNYLEKFNKNLWEPRFSFSQKFLKKFNWEILAEFKHQNTSQVINFQNDFLGIEKRRWQLSNNDNIPVIESRQISSAISYSNNDWLFDIDGYVKTVKGITTQSQGFQNQFEFIKSKGQYEVIGFDVLVRKNIKRLNTWMSYSYMDNTYFFSELSESPFSSNYDVTHVLTVGSAYKLKNFKVSAGFNWHSGKPTTEPKKDNAIVNGNINYNMPNSTDLKDYSRLDISAIYVLKLHNEIKADFGLSVWNVLNKKNEINSFYRINKGEINKTTQNSLGITTNAVFRLTF